MEIVDSIFEELECKHNITKEYIKTVIESIKRFEKKQEIFTADNISDWGLVGLASKFSAYQQELKKYLSVTEEKRKELGLTEEKLAKNFLDVGIFGFIAYLYQTDKWED